MMYESERRSRDYYEGRARWYDWANRIASLLRGASDLRERRKTVRRLNLKPGQRVLEVSLGTGSNLRLMAEHLGLEGRMVGLDISPAMLNQCRKKLRRQGVKADLVLGEAAHLPFADGWFDVVFHHGGIAEFGDRRGAIEEMFRGARPGAKIVICDVGVPADRRLSLINRFLLRFQPIYDKPPPIDLVPSAARDVRLTWFRGGAWYMIEMTKP
jgi:ubiquinone/menaquinone biosynthesis C-methylase UbiE